MLEEHWHCTTRAVTLDELLILSTDWTVKNTILMWMTAIKLYLFINAMHVGHTSWINIMFIIFPQQLEMPHSHLWRHKKWITMATIVEVWSVVAEKGNNINLKVVTPSSKICLSLHISYQYITTHNSSCQQMTL